MLKMFRKIRNNYQGGIICLTVIVVMFGGIGIKMGAAPMLNTIMNTAHDLLLNTVFYLMGITVLTGALSKLLSEFGVVSLLERFLRPYLECLVDDGTHRLTLRGTGTLCFEPVT